MTILPDPNPATVADATGSAAVQDMKKKELLDRVVERSGVKRKDAKPVVEAMLAVLGETIGSGRAVNVQPFGKLRINRTEDKPNGRVVICKLRQNARAVAGGKDPLAEPQD